MIRVDIADRAGTSYVFRWVVTIHKGDRVVGLGVGTGRAEALDKARAEFRHMRNVGLLS